jgi:hypothetical protein
MLKPIRGIFMKYQILSCLLLAAAASVASADYTETGKITQIMAEWDNRVSVYLDGADNTSECSGGGRWTLELGADPLFEAKYAAILTAASAGQTVTFRYVSSRGCGIFNGSKIYLVSVKYAQ